MQKLSLTNKYIPYTKYKNSQVGWIGKIPEHWEVKKIRRLFEVKKRIAGRPDIDVLSITQKGIKVKNIKDNGGQLSADYSKYQLVEKGDFAMNHMDLLTGYVDISKYDGVTSPDYRVFTRREISTCDRYFLYLFQMGYQQKLFYPYGRGAAQLGRWRLPAGEFNNFYFPVPSTIEQEKIAQFLDVQIARIDQIIAKKEQLVELIKEKRVAIINQTITRGLDTNTEMIESGIDWIGNIPRGWNINKLKYVTSVDSETLNTDTDPAYEFNYYDVSSVTLGEIEKPEEKITFEKSPSRARRVANVDDVIIATVRPYLKAVAHFREAEGKNIVSTGFSTFTAKKNILPRFLFYYLFSDKFMHEVIIRSVGVSYPAISPNKLAALHISFPDISQQKKISDLLDTYWNLYANSIEITLSSIKKLQQFKSSLIFNAVTGKIKV